MVNSSMMEYLDKTVEYIARKCRQLFFWQWSMQSHWIGARDLSIAQSESHGNGARYLSIADSESHWNGARYLSIAQSHNHWIGARDLSIPHSENSYYWTWSTIPDTSIEVATLKIVNWLDVRGKVDTTRLLQKVSYGAYFVFKLKEYPQNLEKVTARVKFCKEITDGTDHEGFTIFIDKKKGEGETGVFPYQRSDGWMEVQLGLFFNNLGDDGLVDVRLHETDDYRAKQGLIVKGIDIRAL